MPTRDCLIAMARAAPGQNTYELLQVLYARANPEGKGQTESKIEADNQFYIDLVNSPQAKHLIFLHGNLKPLKVLNDRVFASEGTGGKEDVNAVRNLFRILLMERVRQSEFLSKALVRRFTNQDRREAKFFDFKSVELAFDPRRVSDRDRLIQEINHAVRQTQIDFDKAMVDFARHNPELLQRIFKEKGLTSDFRHWHVFGLAEGHPDLAAASSRVAAKAFNPEKAGTLNPRAYSDADLGGIVKKIEGRGGIKQQLVSALGESSPVFRRYENTSHLVLSKETIDILRKSKAKNKEEYIKTKQEEFKTRLGIELTAEQVILLRDYFSEADIFQPSIRQSRRTRVVIDNAKNGFFSVDFAGQNIVNMYHTMGAIAITGSRGNGQRAISLSRQGERLATARLLKLREVYDNARKKAEVEGEFQVTGDDGVTVAVRLPPAIQFLNLYRALAQNGEVPPSDFRPTFVKPLVNPVTRELDTGAMSRANVEAEVLEKDIRAFLHGKVRAAELDQMLIPVHIDPKTKKMEVYLFGASEHTAKLITQEITRGGLVPEGYEVNRIIAER